MVAVPVIGVVDEEGEEEGGKEATSRLLLLGGSDESSGLATASLSQVEDLRLSNNIKLVLGSSFESSSSLQSSPPSGKKNDIQKQKTTTKTYWESPEAKKLFNPLPNESTLNAIDNQIEILRQANNSSSGYLQLIQNLNHINQEDDITHHHKWKHPTKMPIHCSLTPTCKRKHEYMDLGRLLHCRC